MASSGPAEAPGAARRRPLLQARRWRALASQALSAGVLAAGVIGPLPARAETVLVAVASNFGPTLAALAPGFRQASGHDLTAAAGPTARLALQITAGAPFHLLLSADQATPARLLANGQAVPGTRFTYATGHLVLWSAQAGLVDSQGDVLAHGRFRHLALANPKLAPYGEAAMAVLRARGLADKLQARLVMAESIAQAYQFVSTGNAELGFVAWSQLKAPGQTPAGSHWRVPPGLHAPLHQDAVLLLPGAGQPAALALLAYLKTPAAKALMQAHGYGG